jgi:hypothetical protein
VTNHNGKASICDAPNEPIDIVVGRDICGSVIVNDLRYEWPTTHTVFVTYQDEPCDHLALGKEARVLLRILDNTGRPVRGAIFKGRAVGRIDEESDELGRLFIIAQRGSRVEGVVEKDGMANRVLVAVADDSELAIIIK